MHIHTHLLAIAFTSLPFLSAFAQEAESKQGVPPIPADSTQTDSVPAKKKVSFLTRLVKLVDFNNPDTRYITPNLYNFTFMLNTTSSYEYYRIGGNDQDDNQSISFAPTPSWKIGAYVGWRWIFLGWSIDVADLFGSKNKIKKTEYNLSLYSAKLGGDFYYLRSGNGFRIRDFSGFEKPAGVTGSQDFDGLKVNMIGVNAYYIFNNRRFSYPAAFSQSTNQRKSAGSFLTGFSYSTHKLSFRSEELPQWVLNQMDESMFFEHIRYNDYSFNFGYAYNWVFAKNCLACLSVTPAVAYKLADIDSKDSDYNQNYRSINFDVITRAAVVYNNAKYYVGASLLAHTYDYHKKRFWVNNTYGLLQIYVGFNFSKKR